MEPRDQGRWMAETERRLRTLEQSARVPALSLPGSKRGIQIDHNIGGFFTGSGAKSGDPDITYYDSLSPAESLPAVQVETTTTGRILYMIGGLLRPNSGDVSAYVRFIDSEIGEFYPGVVYLNSVGATGTAEESAMTAGMVDIGLPAGSLVTVKLGLSTGDAADNSGIYGPWLIAIPL